MEKCNNALFENESFRKLTDATKKNNSRNKNYNGNINGNRTFTSQNPYSSALGSFIDYSQEANTSRSKI